MDGGPNDTPAPDQDSLDQLEIDLSVLDGKGPPRAEAPAAPAPRAGQAPPPAAATGAASRPEPPSPVSRTRSPQTDAVLPAPGPARAGDAAAATGSVGEEMVFEQEDGGDAIALAPYVPTPPEVDPETGAAQAAASAAAGVGSPAQTELRRRVTVLLDEARAASAQGRTEDALSALARVFVLDEENLEARALEERIRAGERERLREIEGWLTEGVQDFDQGRLEEAAAQFRKVLEVAPHHAEAKGYLEQIAAAGLPKAEQPDLGAVPIPAPPVPAAPAASPPASAPGEPSLFSPGVSEGVPLAVESTPGPARRPRPAAPVEDAIAAEIPARGGSTAMRILVALVILGALAAAAWLVPPLVMSAHEPSVADAGPKQPATAAAPSTPSAAQPGDRLDDVPALAAKAKACMDAGDYAGAVVAYNRVLRLDPSDPTARPALLEAGRLYREQKVRTDQLANARAAFEREEYAAALRILYRLPQGTEPALVEQLKADGWYNLGLIALKAGDCPQAIQQFDEALAIRPGDAQSKEGRALAERYKDTSKDRAYYDQVETINFRRVSKQRVSAGSVSVP